MARPRLSDEEKRRRGTYRAPRDRSKAGLAAKAAAEAAQADAPITRSDDERLFMMPLFKALRDARIAGDNREHERLSAEIKRRSEFQHRLRAAERQA